jgi:hypothetical protein
MNRGTELEQVAGRLCRAWVRLYTVRLPAEAKVRRRQEIESDLFEHHADAESAGVSRHRLAAEILGRVLVGVPADLTWRRALRRQSHTRLYLGGTPMSISTTTASRLLNILGALTILYVWGLILGDAFVFTPAEDEIGLELLPFLVWGLPPVLGSIAMGVGLLTRDRNPRRAFRLIVAGSIGPAVWFWMLPVYGPLAIATIAVATVVTPRKRARPTAPAVANG